MAEVRLAGAAELMARAAAADTIQPWLCNAVGSRLWAAWRVAGSVAAKGHVHADTCPARTTFLTVATW